MNTEVVPVRLKEARESRGVGVTELSETLGVTSQAVSQYEEGIMKPSVFILKKMAAELNFPMEFFYKEKLVNDCNKRNVYFKLPNVVPKKVRQAYAVRIEWANEIYLYINQYVELKEVRMPDLNQYFDQGKLRERNIEEIASEVRRCWKIGSEPIANLIELLEDQGVMVCKTPFQFNKIAAFSSWYDDVPYIFYRAAEQLDFGRRWDMAHELGHLLLHPFLKEKGNYHKGTLTRVEKEADEFAAAFLMPAESIAKDVLHYSLDYFIMLREKWKVPLKAIIGRSRQLELLNESQFERMDRQIAARKRWDRSFLEYQAEAEEPTILIEAIHLLVDNNVLSPKEILEDLALPKEEIIAICNMPGRGFEEEQTGQRNGRLRIVK